MKTKFIFPVLIENGNKRKIEKLQKVCESNSLSFYPVEQSNLVRLIKERDEYETRCALLLEAIEDLKAVWPNTESKGYAQPSRLTMLTAWQRANRAIEKAKGEA